MTATLGVAGVVGDDVAGEGVDGIADCVLGEPVVSGDGDSESELGARDSETAADCPGVEVERGLATQLAMTTTILSDHAVRANARTDFAVIQSRRPFGSYDGCRDLCVTPGDAESVG